MSTQMAFLSDFHFAKVDWVETPTSHVLTVDVPGVHRNDIIVKVPVPAGDTKISPEKSSGSRVQAERDIIVKVPVPAGDTKLMKISGKRPPEKSSGSVQAAERVTGSFTREFTLPEGVIPEETKAFADAGVLTLVIPKLLPPEVDQTAKLYPRTDVIDYPTDILYCLDLPGLKARHVNVAVTEGSQLHITGYWKRGAEMGIQHIAERRSGRIDRHFDLPDAAIGAKMEDIHHVMKDGVLKIYVPKRHPPLRIRCLNDNEEEVVSTTHSCIS